MFKPKAEEIHQAVELAKVFIDKNLDRGGLAKSFLYFHERNLYLEQVYEQLEQYLRSGMAERQHTRLITTLERARDAEYRCQHHDREGTFGLG